MEIDELTSEQKARFEEWCKKWIETGLSTEPTDFDVAEKNALRAYQLAKLEKPTVVLRMNSPYSALVGSALVLTFLMKKKAWSSVTLSDLNSGFLKQSSKPPGKQIHTQVMDQVRKQVKNPVWEQCYSMVLLHVMRTLKEQLQNGIKDQGESQFLEQILNQTKGQAMDQIRNLFQEPRQNNAWDFSCAHIRELAVNGINEHIEHSVIHDHGISSWAGLCSFVSFFRDVVGLNDEISEGFEIEEALVQSCGNVWWHEKVLAISDRPKEIHKDAEGRLHNEKGPSISWCDGWGLYHWHGVAVPKDWVMGKPPLAKDALVWPNMEQRRAACEIVGWKTILKDLDAEVIDEDGDPEIGILFEAYIPDSGEERFLQVRCGTGREFVLPVPPHVKTALEANAWTWNLESYQYRPEVRT